MSVSISSVRILHVNQTRLDSHRSELLPEGEGWFLFDGKFFHTDWSYYLFEIVSYGWEQGARSRVKRLSLNRALGYINKLHSGGWIDDDVYHAAYTASGRLLRSHFDVLELE